MDKEDLKKIVHYACQSEGMHKLKPNFWYWTGSECISVINLQKSNYSELFYVNIGTFICELDLSNMSPTIDQCHFVTRMEAANINGSSASSYFDLENSINDELRAAGIDQAIRKVAIPEMFRFNTKQGIVDKCAENIAFMNGVKIEAKRLLGLPIV
jgi:hypothetical protein